MNHPVGIAPEILVDICGDESVEGIIRLDFINYRCLINQALNVNTVDIVLSPPQETVQILPDSTPFKKNNRHI